MENIWNKGKKIMNDCDIMPWNKSVVQIDLGLNDWLWPTCKKSEFYTIAIKSYRVVICEPFGQWGTFQKIALSGLLGYVPFNGVVLTALSILIYISIWNSREIICQSCPYNLRPWSGSNFWNFPKILLVPIRDNDYLICY